ncbi:uncharacterized protein LOC124666146 [Lolium rigidum]|uniref:uncharacterized protein LOC124666146 n=1 Tax=Lolium rigidum TaxID=89674 RepID=UPI001F5E32C1|nr:uncharacterized protein LOC124666146 [Lolium rigidum]
MESSSSSLLTSSTGNKRAREADLAAEEAEGKRLRPEDLLSMLDDETDTSATGDLASVMRSLEEEISAGELDLDLEPSPPQPELGFLLEASDDDLGLPPAGGSYTSSDDYGGAAGAALFGEQIWGFEDEIDGGAGDYGFGAVTSSPEAAAAAAAAAAEWGDDGFGDGLFGFGDESFGAPDLAALRQETMPAV